MRHVSLFTGIGGLDLAAEWAGCETVLQVERDPYCIRVLQKHWPDVLRLTDVRDVTGESVDGPIGIVSGGFPCQPFSAAGKRRGRDDDRYLWPEFLRVVRELAPAWVVGENVRGLLSLDNGGEFDAILSDLEGEGYEVLPVVYPAHAVGAPHQRYRVFIVAHSNGAGLGERRWAEPIRAQQCTAECGCKDVADAGGERRQQNARSTSCHEETHGRESHSDHEPTGHGKVCGAEQWESEPRVGRVAHGVPHRVDRLRALGNAVVPQQAYPIFAAIMKSAWPVVSPE